MGDLTFPRTARHGQRRVVGMWRDWNELRQAMACGDLIRAQAAFDECEPWIDWCFGMAAERKEGE